MTLSALMGTMASETAWAFEINRQRKVIGGQRKRLLAVAVAIAWVMKIV